MSFCLSRKRIPQLCAVCPSINVGPGEGGRVIGASVRLTRGLNWGAVDQDCTLPNGAFQGGQDDNPTAISTVSCARVLRRNLGPVASSAMLVHP